MFYPAHSLAKRLLQEDAEALGQVIRWISQALASPRFWSLRDEWPDLTQETLARVVESLRQERFDPSRDLRIYVQSIARYAAFEARDRRISAPHHGRTDAPHEDHARNPEKTAIDRQLVRRILDLASEDCREMIRRYFLEDQDYATLAEEMGVPVGTVKSRLFRCLECVSQAMRHFPQRKVAASPYSPRQAAISVRNSGVREQKEHTREGS